MFGKVQEDKDIHAGLNFKLPFVESIKKYSIEPSQINMTIEPAVNGALTRDNQTVGTTLKIVWKYDENKIVEIAKNYSEKKLENIVLTISEAGAKNIIGQYDIFSLAEKQETLSREVKARMEEIISDNSYPLTVVDVQTTNFDWSDEFDRQIALTMNRAQEVKQSQQELEKTKIESQKQVAEAEAKRASDIARAEGEQKSAILRAEGQKQASIAQAEADLRTAELRAEAKIVEGEAIKKYNESVKASLDVELALREIEIEKIRVSRWNGVYVPNNMYGPIPVDTAGGVKGY
jgi:regulator of protease activity HflC (stomatin/prohibitin superfamily)